jgi:hypothetical protein
VDNRITAPFAFGKETGHGWGGERAPLPEGNNPWKVYDEAKEFLKRDLNNSLSILKTEIIRQTEDKLSF